MAGRQSLRSTLAFAAVATVVWAIVSVKFDGTSLKQIAFYLPFFFALIVLMMRLTNRLTVALANRLGKQPARGQTAPAARPAVPQPASERPEHAQRRRSARRPRGGDRRRR